MNVPSMNLDLLSNLCSDQRKYITVEKIGYGNFGEVSKIRTRATPWNGFFAMKTFREKFKGQVVDEESCFKEIELLRLLNHINVVKMYDIVKDDSKGALHPKYSIVLEFCEHDLLGLLVGKVDLPQRIKKNISAQILEGLRYLFNVHVMHRDLKPSNILLRNNGVVKITDFGMSKRMDRSPNSIKITTLYYRAPEVILGHYQYDYKIDMWALGCIMAQMWKREPLLEGDDEAKQLKLISRMCGPINKETWPGVDKLPYHWIFSSDIETKGLHMLPYKLQALKVEPEAADLIDHLLKPDPTKRLDVFEALSHPFIVDNVASNFELMRLLSQLPQYMLHQAVFRRVYDENSEISTD